MLLALTAPLQIDADRMRTTAQTAHSARGMPRLEQPFESGKWDEPSEKDLGETLRNSRQAGGEIPAEVTREQTGGRRAVKVGCQGPERSAPGPGPILSSPKAGACHQRHV